jgi:enolase-phosphatase E1
VARPILTDLEGTTSAIAFVKQVLFPHARRALPAFVASRGGEPEVRRRLDQVAAETGAGSDAELVTVLQSWIDQDRKQTALKALQGMIWRDGYQQGAYRAHIYEDAAERLRAWHAAGHPLYVYSSGSVAAQQLFMRHSRAGDLSGLFAGWFDTEIGGKREPESYRRIAAAIGAGPAQLWFLSDVVAELDAARAAGCDTVLVDRRADHPEPRTGAAAGGHRRVESFTAIDPA